MLTPQPGVTRNRRSDSAPLCLFLSSFSPKDLRDELKRGLAAAEARVEALTRERDDAARRAGAWSVEMTTARDGFGRPPQSRQCCVLAAPALHLSQKFPRASFLEAFRATTCCAHGTAQARVSHAPFRPPLSAYPSPPYPPADSEAERRAVSAAAERTQAELSGALHPISFFPLDSFSPPVFNLRHSLLRMRRALLIVRRLRQWVWPLRTHGCCQR